MVANGSQTRARAWRSVAAVAAATAALGLSLSVILVYLSVCLPVCPLPPHRYPLPTHTTHPSIIKASRKREREREQLLHFIPPNLGSRPLWLDRETRHCQIEGLKRSSISHLFRSPGLRIIRLFWDTSKKSGIPPRMSIGPLANFILGSIHHSLMEQWKASVFCE